MRQGLAVVGILSIVLLGGMPAIPADAAMLLHAAPLVAFDGQDGSGQSVDPLHHVNPLVPFDGQDGSGQSVDPLHHANPLVPFGQDGSGQ